MHAQRTEARQVCCQRFPKGWTGKLASQRLTPVQLEALEDLRLESGEVYELTK